jgi:transcriptional regulator with XRE-family HTH domain
MRLLMMLSNQEVTDPDMGRASRQRPARLGEKLRRIRLALDLSQDDMVIRLGFKGMTREYISGYERNIREPPIPVLLAYSRLGGCYMEVLADDDLELSEKLPGNPKYEGIKRSSISKRKRSM